MSLNSNSTRLLRSELNQTHQKNELTHKLICFFSVTNQSSDQSVKLSR